MGLHSIKAVLGLLSLTTLLVPPVHAKPVAPTKPALNLIKINQYYVLYTCPITPRLDKSGTFIVGAEAIAQMLNAKFTQNPQGTVVTMTKAGHFVRFTAGARTALVNGKPVALPVAAQVNSQTQQMLVPLSPLVKAFGIPSTWNQALHTLTLTGKTLMNNIDPDSLSNVYAEVIGPDTHSLIPVGLNSVVVRPFPRGDTLKLTVQNVSHHTIPQYHSFINFLTASKQFTPQTSFINYGIGGTPFPPDIAAPDPPWKPGATHRTSAIITFPPSPAGYTLYVAVWPVVSRRR